MVAGGKGGVRMVSSMVAVKETAGGMDWAVSGVGCARVEDYREVLARTMTKQRLHFSNRLAPVVKGRPGSDLEGGPCLTCVSSEGKPPVVEPASSLYRIFLDPASVLLP